MSEAGFSEREKLSEARVGILGLGLMGGSLALALRGHCAAILGSDLDPGILRLAMKHHVVDQAALDPAEILPQVDLLILATPVLAILDLLAKLDQFHPGRAVVMDLGSTKVHITQAMAALSERFDPIGGHPMCGTEKSSLVSADPLLYRGAVFALTALPRTTEWAKKLALELVLAVGSHPLWIDPALHDRWVAATSHLPYLLANALVLSTPSDAAPLVGPGFLSTSRLAGSFSPMMVDVLLTNRENILAALQNFRSSLENFGARLEKEDYQALAALLQESAQFREELSSKGGVT